MEASTHSVNYLQRDPLYEEEKPYKTTFDTSELGGPSTNCKFSARDIRACYAESSRDELSLDVNGFQFSEWPTQLLPSDFENEEIVTRRYYPEILDLVKTVRPGTTHIDILFHSRRNASINEDTVLSDRLYRPVPYVHADYTPSGAVTMMKKYFDIHPEMRDKPFEIINVWRVTQGPTRNWPLALCDYQSLSIPKDLEQADIIHRTSVGEQTLLYWNENHQWYFLKEQHVTDVIVLRHADSRGTHIPFAPHASLENEREAIQGRKSIEVQVACFYS